MKPLDEQKPGVCVICGGESFRKGPNDRKSSTGKMPRCSQCGSLERHRRLRSLYSRFPGNHLAGLKVLQLSPDIGVEPGWFETYEVSVHGGENSLDLEAIDRPDACYDLVICNHVLEHVADDRKGFRELMRIVNPAGAVQITLPTPYTREVTVDWGYPRVESYGHYRGYGRDVLQRFVEEAPEFWALEVDWPDGVTGAGDYIYFWARERRKIDQIRTWCGTGRVVGNGAGG